MVTVGTTFVSTAYLDQTSFNNFLQGLSEAETASPSKREYQRVLQENLGADLSSTRVLSYQAKAPAAPDSHSNNLKILYSSSKSQSSAKKFTRHIPQVE